MLALFLPRRRRRDVVLGARRCRNKMHCFFDPNSLIFLLTLLSRSGGRTGRPRWLMEPAVEEPAMCVIFLSWICMTGPSLVRQTSNKVTHTHLYYMCKWGACSYSTFLTVPLIGFAKYRNRKHTTMATTQRRHRRRLGLCQHGRRLLECLRDK